MGKNNSSNVRSCKAIPSSTVPRTAAYQTHLIPGGGKSYARPAFTSRLSHHGYEHIPRLHTDGRCDKGPNDAQRCTATHVFAYAGSRLSHSRADSTPSGRSSPVIEFGRARSRHLLFSSLLSDKPGPLARTSLQRPAVVSASNGRCNSLVTLQRTEQAHGNRLVAIDTIFPRDPMWNRSCLAQNTLVRAYSGLEWLRRATLPCT